jgi:hypothetical protein
MNLFHLTGIAAVLLFAYGCEHTPQTPGSAKQNYPAIITDSTDRRARAEREWRRMLDAYSVPQTPPDLHPVIYTPRSLLGVSGGIKLLAVAPDPDQLRLANREAVKRFMERWHELLGVDPAVASLERADESSAENRFTYRQSNYAFPIRGNYGEMVAVVSADGRLLQLDDRFIPMVELPSKPQIERQNASQRVVGRTFTYSDLAGREQRVQINRADEVTAAQLVVLPIEKADAIEVHLAWEVVAGSSLTWTIYLDAMTGDELRIMQNFNT